MFKVIKKADIILFIVLLLFGLCLTWYSISGGTSGDTVVVTVDGEVYGSYSLDTDKVVRIEIDGHVNEFSISDGTVQMTYANCSNQDCVLMGSIDSTNQSIVCLPNKVIIEIQGASGDVDALAK